MVVPITFTDTQRLTTDDLAFRMSDVRAASFIHDGIAWCISDVVDRWKETVVKVEESSVCGKTQSNAAR